MRKRGIASLVAIVLISVTSVVVTQVVDNEPQLGLDLQGGFSVVLTARGNPTDGAVEQATNIIRQRVDGLGIAEPEVVQQGDTVIVQLPGVDDRRQAQEIVGRTAKLEFRPVLQDGLPINADAGPDEDPCAPEDPTATTTTTSTTTTLPPAPPTAPTTPSTAPPTTAAPAAGGDETGAPVPGLVPGESALGAQAPVTTTTAPTTATTAPAGSTTTAAPGATTTTVPAEEGEGPVTVPDQEERGCLQLGPIGFEGDALSSSKATTDPATGTWRVEVSVKDGLKDEANAAFNACQPASATCPSGRIAIVLDDVVVSSPTVQEQNLASDVFNITGDFSSSEAKDLELVLRYGALPVEFERSAEQQVSATLGRESLDAGLLAGVIGLVAVALYMLFYYRALGVVVILGLTVWAGLMYSIISYLSARSGLALTLAGITGIVVSVGTTVDSYVVYFERLKEEIRTGKTVRSATQKGFQQAFRTMLTADVASFIGAAILWFLTVGPVRGFAFFLGLSVVLDLLVAAAFTRPLVAILSRSEFFTEARFFGVARGLGRRRPPQAAMVGGGGR